MKTALRILAMITSALLVVPALFLPYKGLFPLLYFCGLGLFFKRDDDALFYGYWIIAFLLTILLSKLLFRLFSKLKSFIIASLCAGLLIFTAFAINVFPYYGRFPDVTVTNLIHRHEREIAYAFEHATNNHPAPPFYDSDKKRIEQAFMRYNSPFYDAIKLTFARSMSIHKDTIPEKHADTLNYKLYQLFIANADESVKKIMVDTIIYDRNFSMLFVAMIYKNDLNTYGEKVFIGYKQSGNDTAIRLYPYESVLFPNENTKASIAFSMRRAYFSNEYGSIGPLDNNFWKAPLFTPGATVDTTYLVGTAWAGHISPCPVLIVP